MLKQPRLLARRLTNIASKRFVADRIFLPGTPDQVAGGAARYQRAQSIYLNRDPQQVATRANFPRAGWSEDLREAAVEQHGLEVPVNALSIRRNAMDQLQRALLLLSNSVVKYVDGMAMSMILADTDVLSDSASASWDTTTTDIIGDIAEAQMQIRQQNEGYDPTIMVINDTQALAMLRNQAIREALPREGRNQVTTGQVLPILGLEQIIVTPNIPDGTIIIMDRIAGTIADEAPVPAEGYSTYQPQGDSNLKPVYLKTWEEQGTSDWVIRGARWPAMWLAEPKAVFVMDGAE
jgi:hypothetical protein